MYNSLVRKGWCFLIGGGAMNNQRQYERKPYKKNIFCFLSIHKSKKFKLMRLKCCSVDISEGGAGVLTDYPVSPGSAIKFENDLDYKSGIAVWSRRVNDTDYRVGIKFTDEPSRLIEPHSESVSHAGIMRVPVPGTKKGAVNKRSFF